MGSKLIKRKKQDKKEKSFNEQFPQTAEMLEDLEELLADKEEYGW